MAVNETKLPERDPSVNVPFTDLMGLETVDETTFRNKMRAFQMGHYLERPNFPSRVFGGHVMAQGLLAASKELELKGEKDFIINSLDAYFLSGGDTQYPFEYTVSTLRDGRSYSVKHILVRQSNQVEPFVSMHCSFNRNHDRRDPHKISFQQQLDIKTEFASVLRGRHPIRDLEDGLTYDLPFLKSLQKIPIFHGTVSGKDSMAPYNDTKDDPLDRRQANFYGGYGTFPEVHNNPNMHAALHVYWSDVGNQITSNRNLNMLENWRSTASLSHKIVFHVGAGQALSTHDDKKNDRWFCQVVKAHRVSLGRAYEIGNLWDQDGTHIATYVQDGASQWHFKDDQDLERTRSALAKGKAKI